MGPAVLPSVFTLKGMSRKLLLLGTVVGALSFLSPAYAEVWNFAGPTSGGSIITTPVASTTYTGSDGTVIDVSVAGTGLPVPPGGLITKTLSADEMGLGIANDPSGEDEITPGSWIAVRDVGLTAPFISFQMNSTTGADAWEVVGAQTFDGLSVGTMLASCSANGAGVGNTCEQVKLIPNPNVPWLLFTATSGNVLLKELDTVPLPGALWLFGTGLAGLGFVGRRRRSKQVSAL